VIPVEPRPEPAFFDQLVRQPGLRWLEKQGILLDRELPQGTELHPYWRKCLDELHGRYAGVCAYLCVYLEREAGGLGVDHFIAKSRQVALAYEWTNYRLASSTMNGRKLDFDTVLDPFTLRPGTYRLELVTGRIFVNPDLDEKARTVAQDTIDRLKLDNAGCREMRARHYEQYRTGQYTQEYFKSYSPFVWAEAKRQGLL
jgi:hypothetical protein